ncbi:alpha/beta hydrolase [Pseudozobellia thermophila]|uniref:alpha/beta hydrolase n=1 Tax=Pseudozobellia thermophila TaxID=192903 RepID=UPI000AED46DA|nr:esterase [Pseudozobellia thermophila]
MKIDFTMAQQEKTISYTSINSYSTLNELTANTKNLWVVFHGMGHLSRYFIKHFDQLPPEENYIIAPQAPSKYYLNDQFRHVGASWLTKEETARETENVIAYIESIMLRENLPEHLNVIVLGFSQGVSIATRWVAQKRVKCQQLVLYAGGIPKELKPDDFDFFEETKTKVTLLVGENDEYIDAHRLKTEVERAGELFGNEVKKVIFEGRHELKKELINSLIP